MKPCRLCRRPARYGRACDECRERVRSAPARRPPRRPSDLPAGAVSTVRFRDALRRSTDHPDVVADLLDWKPARLRRVLAQEWVHPQTADKLCAALHVAPFEVGR